MHKIYTQEIYVRYGQRFNLETENARCLQSCCTRDFDLSFGVLFFLIFESNNLALLILLIENLN